MPKIVNSILCKVKDEAMIALMVTLNDVCDVRACIENI